MTFMHNTRRTLAALAVASSLALSSIAPVAAQQEISPEHLTIARQYVDMTDGGSVYEISLIEISVATLRTLIQQEPTLGDVLPETIQAVFDEYIDRKDDLFDQFARLYAVRFTQEEMQEIVDFYTAPLGQKLLSQNSAINSDMQNLLGVWGNNVRSEFLAKVRAGLREQGYEI